MFWRALFAFLAVPGVLAFLIPALIVQYAPGTTTFYVAGLVPVILGTILLLWCVRDVSVVGKGTLAPSAPPRKLVAIGLYRRTRNPMYVAVSLILLGWAASFWSVYILIYAIGMMIWFHLWVVFGEEPWMARMFGEAYEQYRTKVPRWLI